MEQPKLALRVFKRSSRYLVLLWKKMPDANTLETTIEFKDFKSSDQKVTKLTAKQFQINESAAQVDAKDLGDLNIGADTIICLVKEKETGLDTNALYYVTVHYGGTRESIRLTTAGVFPSHEKEDRQKNVHLCGWDDESQCWRKVSVVKGPRGQYFLGTISMGPKEEMMEE